MSTCPGRSTLVLKVMSVLTDRLHGLLVLHRRGFLASVAGQPSRAEHMWAQLAKGSVPGLRVLGRGREAGCHPGALAWGKCSCPWSGELD